jgi:hypothetical protein
MGIKIRLGTIAPVVMKLELPPWEIPEGATTRKSRVWDVRRGWRNNKSAQWPSLAAQRVIRPKQW